MARPKREVIIERQIKIWEDRAWKPDVMPLTEINEDGEVIVLNNEKYENLIKRDRFVFVYSETQDDVYRFLRYGIEKAILYNSNILFARESLFNAYINANIDLRSSYKYCDELISIIAKDYKGKWVVCDNLNTEFNDNLLVYFLSQLQKNGARGFITHCDKKLPNNIYSCAKTSKASDIADI